MLLTNCEREFLAAFIHEATTDPFQGPATEELHWRDIYYTDLPHLLAAYYQESGSGQDDLGGRKVAALPPCPWVDREAATRRDHEVEGELERASEQPVSSRG
ncbi:MAG TPA: hypothetical protein VML55_12525 [Planctomycetaceae bacterium]|nr:hypothetical protein [Planctomycetaceae bacterium]